MVSSAKRFRDGRRSPLRAPLSTLVWDLRILRVKVMRQCPPSGLSSLGSSWFIRTDGLSFWGLTLMLSRCRVLGLSRVTSLGRAAPPPPSLVPTPQPPFGTLGLWLPATFGSCSRSGVPEKAGNELPCRFCVSSDPKRKTVIKRIRSRQIETRPIPNCKADRDLFDFTCENHGKPIL